MHTLYVGQPVRIVNPTLRTFNQIGSIRMIDGPFIAVSLPGDTICTSCFAADDLEAHNVYAKAQTEAQAA